MSEYYCENNPNPNFAQYGWPRTRVSGVMGVHTTESGVYFEGRDPGVENTAEYIRTRLTPGSYHIMADWDSRLKLVRPTFSAWADITNNAHALSVSGAMNAARWRDLPPERAAQIVRNMGLAAAELVLDAIAHGVLDNPIPAVRITPEQAISGSHPGFYGHGETNPGTRYDPGQNFDWDLFLSTYAAAIGGNIPEENDVGQLTGIDDKVYNDLIVGIRGVVKTEVSNIEKSVAFQEKFAVKMFTLLQTTLEAVAVKVEAEHGVVIDTKAIANEIQAELARGIAD